jgi:beta-phosphoglucomutase
MIRAIVFDLDGVLVQSEKLKAKSYAIAIQKILNLPEPDSRAIEAYQEIVGAPREVASQHIVEKLGLEEKLRPLQSEYHASQPSEVLTAMRVSIYSEIIADPEVLRKNQWPHTVAVLRTAKEMACSIGLATMSRRTEAEHVLRSLNVEQFVDVIVSSEDVEHGKPDPEIYILVTQKLKATPIETLALEDSANGVKSALAAGVNVIAIATPFTNCALQADDIVEAVGSEWIVRDPDEVANIVHRRIEKENQGKQRPTC